MSKFYAVSVKAPNEIAIFNTEEERDTWINYEDEFSLHYPSLDYDRVALSYEEALLLAGDVLNDELNYVPDDVLENVFFLDVQLTRAIVFKMSDILEGRVEYNSPQYDEFICTVTRDNEKPERHVVKTTDALKCAAEFGRGVPGEMVTVRFKSGDALSRAIFSRGSWIMDFDSEDRYELE